MSNRERAEALARHAWKAEYASDAFEAIEAALDEAERAGIETAGKIVDECYAILDKVVEMDTLAGRCSHFKQAPHQPDCIECSTGLGPIGRYVKEARDVE